MRQSTNINDTLAAIRNRLGDLERRLQGRTRILTGTGTPEGRVVAPVGTIYARTDGGAGTTLYVKEAGVGATGWAAK